MEVDEETRAVVVQGLLNNVYKYCIGCGVLIEKDGGCNYIKCVLCNLEMCWMCGLEKYGSGCNNAAHNSH